MPTGRSSSSSTSPATVSASRIRKGPSSTWTPTCSWDGGSAAARNRAGRANRKRGWTRRRSDLQRTRLYPPPSTSASSPGAPTSSSRAAARLLAGKLLYALGTEAVDSAEKERLLKRSRTNLDRAVDAAGKPEPGAEYLLGRLAERFEAFPEAIDHYWLAADPRQAPSAGTTRSDATRRCGGSHASPGGYGGGGRR